MKKHTNLLITIIILMIVATLVITISNKMYYSKEKILSIINRNNEKFSNIYIKVERVLSQRNEIYIDEIYSKDNVIYADSYMKCLGDDDIVKRTTDIWNFETKERLSLNHIDKTFYTFVIRGKRTS